MRCSRASRGIVPPGETVPCSSARSVLPCCSTTPYPSTRVPGSIPRTRTSALYGRSADRSKRAWLPSAARGGRMRKSMLLCLALVGCATAGHGSNLVGPPKEDRCAAPGVDRNACEKARYDALGFVKRLSVDDQICIDG